MVPGHCFQAAGPELGTTNDKQLEKLLPDVAPEVRTVAEGSTIVMKVDGPSLISCPVILLIFLHKRCSIGPLETPECSTA